MGDIDDSQDESVLLCTSGYDRQIRFWEAPTGQCNKQIPTGDSQVNTLIISPDKRLLAAAGNPIVKLYSLSPFSREPYQTLEGHTNNVVSMGFPRHQKWLFTGSEDGTVKIWDLRTAGCSRDKIIKDKKTFVNSSILHPNQGEIICGDQSGTLSIYDIAENKIRTQWQQDMKSIPIRAVTMSNDASMLCVANNRGMIYVYKPTNLIKLTQKLNSNSSNNNSNNKSDSNNFDIKEDINDDNNDDNNNNNNKDNNFNYVQTMNTKADKQGIYTLTHKITAHNTYILNCKLSPDNRYLASCSSDGTIVIFDVYNNFKKKVLKGHTKWVWDMAFSADSAYLVSASSDKTAKLWDLKTGQYIIQYEDHNKGVTCVALNDSAAQTTN